MALEVRFRSIFHTAGFIRQCVEVVEKKQNDEADRQEDEHCDYDARDDKRLPPARCWRRFMLTKSPSAIAMQYTV